MQPQRICLTTLLTLLAIVSTSFAPALFSMQVLAQATDARKAEADRLLQQGTERYKNKQLYEALTVLEKALARYSPKRVR